MLPLYMLTQFLLVNYSLILVFIIITIISIVFDSTYSIVKYDKLLIYSINYINY